MRCRSLLALAAAVMVPATLAAQSPPPLTDTTFKVVYYDNGSLRLEGYLYLPKGTGSFPVVIYNHGSRAGAERVERPFTFVGNLLSAAGYAVLVPERRGYGKSDGATFAEAVGDDKGAKFVARLQAESEDVLASLAFLRTVPGIDTTRVAIMGWSFGGITSVLAASRSPRFLAVVNQAGASLSWKGSPTLQKTLIDAAGKIRAPMICMVADNDATTDAVRAVCNAAHSAGDSTTLRIYPPFTPARPAANSAPGHAIFSAEGAPIWGAEVVAFLDRHVRR